MKKTISLFLALLLLLLPLLCACGGETETEKKTETPTVKTEEETEEKEAFYLDDVHFEPTTVTIHVRGDEDAIVEIGADTNGTILQNALYERTKMTEERLNVEIEVSPQDPYSSYNSTTARLRTSINAGDAAFDLVAGWSCRIPPLAIEGLFKDLNSTKYYHSEDPWWSRSVTKAMTVYGKIFLNTGDIAATYMDDGYCVVVNQDVADSFGYDYKTFYDIVKAGEWTMDFFYQLVKDAYSDDGNQVRDGADLYGLACSTQTASAFWAGAEICIIQNNGIDKPELNYDVDYIQGVAEKFHALFYDNIGAFTEVTTLALTQECGKLFCNSQAMFTIQRLKALETFKTMEFMYGVLPTPKYNEAQKEYHTFVQEGFSLWGIPVDVKSEDVSSATLSSLGYDSHEIVIIPHYETLLKLQYVKDSESGEMIDLIYNGIYMNFDSLFNESLAESVSASNRGQMPVYIFWQMSSSTTPNIERWWSENGRGLANYLEEILANIGKL